MATRKKKKKNPTHIKNFLSRFFSPQNFLDIHNNFFVFFHIFDF